MSNNAPCELSSKLLYSLKTSKPNLNMIKAKINDFGYKIVYYSHLCNSKDVEKLLSDLKVTDFAATVNSFLYCGKEVKVVFIREDFSEDMQFKLLTHELGHIIRNSMDIVCPGEADTADEFFANEFTHYVLHPPLYVKLFISLKQHTLLYLLSLFAIIGVLVVSGLHYSVSRRRIPAANPAAVTTTLNGVKTDDPNMLYVSTSGAKFHRYNCMYIKGKSNLIALTYEEADKSKYQPCRVCCSDFEPTDENKPE